MQTLIFILKGHIRPLLCRVIFNNFQIFWSNYNIILFLIYKNNCGMYGSSVTNLAGNMIYHLYDDE
jgi:hypothetical protein